MRQRWTLNIVVFWFWTSVSTSGVIAVGFTKAQNLPNPATNHLVNVISENHLKEDSFLCYGVKFQPKYFLTTASCFERFRRWGNLTIKENTIFISSVQHPNGPRVAAVGILEHPNYDRYTKKRYDLAILRVSDNLDGITSTDLPKMTPVYGTTFCSLTAFDDKMNLDGMIDLKGHVIPTKDCVVLPPNEPEYSFCVQLQHSAKINNDYISGAPVTCNDTDTVFGVYSWGYDSNKDINKILVTSFASQLIWIKDHQYDEFPLPGQTPPTTSDPNLTKPTSVSDSGPTPPPNNDNDSSYSTIYYPDYDDSAMTCLPLSLTVLLVIATCVIINY